MEGLVARCRSVASSTPIMVVSCQAESTTGEKKRIKEHGHVETLDFFPAGSHLMLTRQKCFPSSFQNSMRFLYPKVASIRIPFSNSYLGIEQLFTPFCSIIKRSSRGSNFGQPDITNSFQSRLTPKSVPIELSTSG